EPAFIAGGTVTAGNSSPLNDGASAAVILSDEKAREWGVQPKARVLAMAVAGVSPEIMGIGPVPAVGKALARAGLQLSDIDVIELNEAFAAQSIAVIRELGIDEAKLNPHGGAIALGHPLGSSGCRLIADLVNDLEVLDKRLGLATLCVGGGQGVATIIERLGRCLRMHLGAARLSRRVGGPTAPRRHCPAHTRRALPPQARVTRTSRSGSRECATSTRRACRSQGGTTDHGDL